MEIAVYDVRPGDSCDSASLSKLIHSLKPEPLFSEADIERLHWKQQSFVLTKDASARLISNLSEWESEEFLPKGKIADYQGKIFVLSSNGKQRAIGVIASLEMLTQPPACTLLYPGLPMNDDGRLVIGIGEPGPYEELREDFFKVLVEEGPGSAFRPVLGEEVKQRFQQAGKLDLE